MARSLLENWSDFLIGREGDDDIRTGRDGPGKFQKVVPIAGTVADLFYDRLFEIAPGVRPLFPDDMKEQKMKLIAMLATAVTNLHQTDKISGGRGTRQAPCWLRGYRRTLRAGRRRLAVDTGAGSRGGCHAATKSGMDRNLHDAGGRDATRRNGRLGGKSCGNGLIGRTLTGLLIH
jgi:hypothetical protein